jgi:Asp-tRNA(Asn)/Glu-tRNA(Gln) amidotransferase A subunit family amidase
MNELAFRTAADLCSALRRGEIRSRELLEHYLDRIDRLNGGINAVVTLDATPAAYLPAVAAPIGRTRHGMPVGVQIVAPYLRDRTAIDFARQLADVVGGFEPPPGFSPAASARALGENAEGYQLCLLAQRSAQRWNGNRFSRSPLPSGVRP